MFYDDETGLCYNNQRYFDPEVGRYITADPLAESLNLYTYCYNNPGRYVDPFGLCALKSYEGATFSSKTVDQQVDKLSALEISTIKDKIAIADTVAVLGDVISLIPSPYLVLQYVGYIIGEAGSIESFALTLKLFWYNDDDNITGVKGFDLFVSCATLLTSSVPILGLAPSMAKAGIGWYDIIGITGSLTQRVYDTDYFAGASPPNPIPAPYSRHFFNQETGEEWTTVYSAGGSHTYHRIYRYYPIPKRN